MSIQGINVGIRGRKLSGAMTSNSVGVICAANTMFVKKKKEPKPNLNAASAPSLYPEISTTTTPNPNLKYPLKEIKGETWKAKLDL